MIVTSTDGPVTTIELARPDKRNALNHDVIAALKQAFLDAVAADTKVIVLTGQGKAFSAGADLSGPVYEQGFLDKLIALIKQIEETPVPVIAALNGLALGAGLQLAMAADLRVMAPDAMIGIPAARIGVAVDEWTIRRLTSLVGTGMARGMMIGCESLSADRCHDLGFANRLGHLAEAQEWAAGIALLAPLTLRHYKLVFNGDGARDEAPAERHAAMLAAWHSEDIQEGRRARAEKRLPQYKGK